MDEYETLNHPTWDCKYHVVFIPKYRRKVLYKELRKALGEVFRQLAAQKEAKVEEGAFAFRPRAYAFVDSAEIFGLKRGWIYQRKERDSLGANVWRAQA